MPTVETIEQIRQLGQEYWETLTLNQVNELLKPHLVDVKPTPYHHIADSTIELLLGIEFILQKGGNTENE